MDHYQRIQFASLDSMEKGAKFLAQQITPGTVISLQGSLGAGKTTFAKSLLANLGVIETVTSPSYALIQEYQGYFPIAHMDFYRLSTEEEVFDIGALEYIHSNEYVCIIEWPERAESILPNKTEKLLIQVLADGIREFQFDPNSSLLSNWHAALLEQFPG
jgi:tRNA threonylcarbamoyladenosine biosynthesis protein TsaE